MMVLIPAPRIPKIKRVISAPAPPMINPSMMNGSRTQVDVAPTRRMIAISSLRARMASRIALTTTARTANENPIKTMRPAIRSAEVIPARLSATARPSTMREKSAAEGRRLSASATFAVSLGLSSAISKLAGSGFCSSSPVRSGSPRSFSRSRNAASASSAVMYVASFTPSILRISLRSELARSSEAPTFR